MSVLERPSLWGRGTYQFDTAVPNRGVEGGSVYEMMPQVIEVVRDLFLLIRPILFLEVAKLMRNLDGPGEVFHICNEHERLQRADYGLDQVPRAVTVTLLFDDGTNRVFDLLDEVLDAAVVPTSQINHPCTYHEETCGDHYHALLLYQPQAQLRSRSAVWDVLSRLCTHKANHCGMVQRARLRFSEMKSLTSEAEM